jgi:hypothetical protein
MLDLTNIKDEIENAEEPKVLDAGEEYELRIIAVNTGTDKNDRDYFMPVFEVPSEPMAKEFTDFFTIPDRNKMTEKDYKRAIYKIKTFAQAFDLDLSRPIDYEDDLIGLTGWAILGVRKDDTYGEQNTIRKYIAGH